MRATQEAAHKDLIATIDADSIKRWQSEVEAWQADPQNSPDLYEEPRPTATYQSVRLKIAEEEAGELAASTLPPHDVSPGVFIQVGLELEEQQRNLKIRQARGATAMSTLADMQEKRNNLSRRIESWQAVQAAHTPIVAQLCVSGIPPALTPVSADGSPPQPSVLLNSLPFSATASPTLHPDNIRLWLPSAIPPTLRGATVSPGLIDKERCLRIAQADDALEDLRHCRHILTGVNEFRRYNVDGMGQHTEGKVRTMYSNFKDKQQRAANRYRAARAALLSLDPNGDWRSHFKDLKQTDIQGPGRDDNTALGEGYYEISWIWLVPQDPTSSSPTPSSRLDQNEFLENVKVKWAKSQACTARWSKEVQLLEEEMRRVVEYFEWRSTWW
ncbi:hypothetical protein GSI_13422 [Ganoderma sinense ZZ0214-1]|uniref:Uncharacterized protein n=1 Tax=Ganoderma sinense ZZ0214-1 TaxID=1077348 RepID=A0A2G8RQ96_9APHY|nr:hypothetical protein GSI_13422 [Ganoderma sinense ZZ0214-1]